MVKFSLVKFKTMGRGRGKGKKLTVSNHDDVVGSGEEEKIPSQKRRGRPQKPLKDELDDEEIEKLEGDDENRRADIVTNDGKKRKCNSQAKEKTDSCKEENGFDTRSSNGYRQNGSRRKSKPRRAAEAVVECK